jgi:two-component system, OmpR family, KDP operon response regulator KdpE
VEKKVLKLSKESPTGNANQPTGSKSAAIKILLIGDEPNILRTLRRNLIGRGYDVSIALDDMEAYDIASKITPDLFVLNLDFTLVNVDGLEICSRLRKMSESPMIVLSAMGSDNIKIQALDQGADDYLVMPFSMDEFLARVRSSLRRWLDFKTSDVKSDRYILIRDLLIDTNARQVTIRKDLVRLTPTEYDLLIYLARRLDKVITHRELLHAVWGNEYGDEREYLRVFISQLRHKIEEDPLKPVYLLTEPGIGYRLASVI